MNELENAYWAGFFDGEGCIRIRTHNRERQNPNWSLEYQLEISLTNTNKAILEEFCNHFGFGGVWRNGKSHKNWKQSYVWKTTNLRATTVIEKILPYLKLKRPQALLALEFYRKKNTYGYGHGIGQRRLPPEVLKERESFFQKMKTLNKKGAN